MTDMRVVFIHKKDNRFFTGSHPDWTYEQFFYRCLKEVFDGYRVVSSEAPLDVDGLEADVLILWDASDWGIPRLKNINTFKGPIILYGNDTHIYGEDDGQRNRYVQELGVTHAFAPLPEEYFYRFAPENVKFFRNYMGIQWPAYACDDQNKCWSGRQDTIISAGALGGAWYDLRYKISIMSGVKHVTHDKGYVRAAFPRYLSRYKAGVAACTVFNVQKYFEVPGAGCVSFMEVTPGHGANDLGFVDGESAIFVDDTNYVERIQDYYNDLDNDKWRDIARRGMEHVRDHYTNDIQAKLFAERVTSIFKLF